MRRTRFFALMLALALTFTMTLPALAYEDIVPIHETDVEYNLPVVRQDTHQDWIDAHPEEYAAFDPYVYFDESYNDWGYFESAQEYIELCGYTEDEFREDMLFSFLSDQLYLEEEAQQLAEIIAAYPEEYAAFDPYAYYNELWYVDSFGTPEEYMAYSKITEEEFRHDMLVE